MLYQQCKIYALLCIILSIIFVTKTEPYGNINKVTDTHITLNNNIHKVSSNIQTEGGAINLNPSTEHHIQESTLAKPAINNVSTEAALNMTINKQSYAIIHGREGINMSIHAQNSSSSVTSNITSHKTVNGTTEKIIPVSEAEIVTTTLKVPIALNVTIKQNTSSTTENTPIEFTGDSKIKPRKGAPTYLPEPTKNITSSTTTTTTTTQKPKKMKPTVTVGSDDEPYPPSNFVPHTNPKKENNSSDLKLKHADGYLGTKYFKKGPDYVLPIVLTILAVPLVAILLAVLYKRGAEWWQHRHYRRMDFLIDGIYNN